MTENFTHRFALGLHRWRPCTRSLHQGFRFAARGLEALRVKCEIHKVYGWHKSVFNQIAPMVTACVSFRATLRTVLESYLLYRPNSTPSSSDLNHNVSCLDLFMPLTTATATRRRAMILCLANGPWQVRGKVVLHCMECCTSREDCVGKFGAYFVGAVAGTNPSIWPQARWLGAEEAIGWIGVLQCIHSLLEIVFFNRDSVRVGGPALIVAAVGMRMQTDRESKRMRLDGWGLHEDPTANAESSGDENGAHDGKLGKDEEVDWGKRRKEQSRFRFSASEWFRHYYMDATAVFMLIAFVLWPLVALMQEDLEVAGDGFETRQSMPEVFNLMVASAPSWLDGLLECVRAKMPPLCLGHDARGAPLDHLAATLEDSSLCNAGLHHVEQHLQLVS